jgi:hypothetical protein
MTDTAANKSTETKHASVHAAAVNHEAARRTADAVQQGGEATSDANHRSIAAVADVTRHGVQVGTETMRRAGEAASETLRRSTQAVTEGQRQIAEDAAKRFQDTSRKMADVARGTSEEMKSFFTLPNAAEGGLRDMQQGVAGLVEGVVQTNLRATQELFRLADPTAMIELQQRFMREYVDAVMQGTTTLVHAIRRTADETLRPLEEQIRQTDQAQQRSQAAAE